MGGIKNNKKKWDNPTTITNSMAFVAFSLWWRFFFFLLRRPSSLMYFYLTGLMR